MDSHLVVLLALDDIAALGDHLLVLFDARGDVLNLALDLPQVVVAVGNLRFVALMYEIAENSL